jgi:hypothetical protein
MNFVPSRWRTASFPRWGTPGSVSITRWRNHSTQPSRKNSSTCTPGPRWVGSRRRSSTTSRSITTASGRTPGSAALPPVKWSTLQLRNLTRNCQVLHNSTVYRSGRPPLLLSEMNRLTRGLANAEVEITNAQVTLGDVQATLNQALTAAANCQAQYEQAPGHVRRLINQGFFKKLHIGPDGSVERYELTEPFATLLTEGPLLVSATRPWRPRTGQTRASTHDQEDTPQHRQKPSTTPSPEGTMPQDRMATWCTGANVLAGRGQEQAPR